MLNSRQKRSSQGQQSQPTGTPQMVISANPFGQDYPLWQQNFSNLQPTMNNFSYLTGTAANNATAGNHNPSSKTSQQLNREYNPRSLLGK